MSFKKWWHDQEPHIRLLAIGLAAFAVWGCYASLPEHPLMAVFYGAMAVFIGLGLVLYW